jgi:hypothetical protein
VTDRNGLILASLTVTSALMESLTRGSTTRWKKGELVATKYRTTRSTNRTRRDHPIMRSQFRRDGIDLTSDFAIGHSGFRCVREVQSGSGTAANGAI